MNPRIRVWTPDEDAALRAGVEAGEPLEDIAARLGRSLQAVRVRRARTCRDLMRDWSYGDVTDARDRFGAGKPVGEPRKFWTRERCEAALRAFIARSRDMLPAGFDDYSRVKSGDPSLPPASAIARELFTVDRPTFGHLWLAYGAPRRRVKPLGGRWTDAEHDYLLSAAGTAMRLVDIAKHLHRSYAACKRRLYDFGTTARNNQGYMSARQVADEYGCDVHRVTRFIERGVLAARLLHGNRYQVDPQDAAAIADLLRAPSSRGKGWRVDATGRPVPPPVKRAPEPAFITRYAPPSQRRAS